MRLSRPSVLSTQLPRNNSLKIARAPRFYEPLPEGPYKGRTTDKKLVDQKLQLYFETLGWDNHGIPTKETLKKLDLVDVEPLMKKLRERALSRS